MKYFIFTLIFTGLIGCATKKETANWDEFHDLNAAPSLQQAKRSSKKSSTEQPKAGSIVVEQKDVQDLEKMVKAVEDYVLRDKKKDFTVLCKDKRFDCFIDEKPYPAKKKKITRTIPPYASGSKMGLKGEHRVQVRYEFYP